MRGEELFTLEAAAYVFLQEACRGRLAAEGAMRVLSRCVLDTCVAQLQPLSNQSTRFSMRTPCSVVPSRRRSVVSTSLGKASFTREKRRQFALVCLGACKRFGHLDVEALVVLVGHEVYLAFKQCAHGHVVATAHELVEYHALELSAQALWGIVAS